MATWAIHKGHGNDAYAQKDFVSAVDQYTKALQLSAPESQTYILYSNRSAANLQLSEFALAKTDAEAALSLQPKFTKALFRRALAFEGLQQLSQALHALQEAKLQQPKDIQIQEAIVRITARLPTSERQHGAAMQAVGHSTAVKPLTAISRQPGAPAKLPANSMYQPSADGVDENLLILLHGYGDTPDAYAKLAGQMALPQTASLALSGPLGPVPGTTCGRAWFHETDEVQPYMPGSEETSSVFSTLRWLQQVVAELQSSGGWRASHMHLFGFSQGGSAALHLALQYRGEQKLGSCIAVSAALLPQQLHSLKGFTATTATTPVLISHGSKDMDLPRREVQTTVAAAKQAGSNVQLHSVPGKGHAMMQGPGEMRVLMAVWAQALKQRPVQPPGAAGRGDGEFVEISGGLGSL